MRKSIRINALLHSPILFCAGFSLGYKSDLRGHIEMIVLFYSLFNIYETLRLTQKWHLIRSVHKMGCENKVVIYLFYQLKTIKTMDSN